MDAAELRRQLHSILQDDVYQESPAGDQDFLGDFEQIVRAYQLARERAAVERVRAAQRLLPKRLRDVPERSAVFRWLAGDQEVT